jgi:hypothetical protein
MFISKDEKKYLFTQVKSLKIDLGHILSDMIFLKGKLKAAEGNIFVLKQIVDSNRLASIEVPKLKKSKVTKPKKVLTPEQKAKQREYMRKYMAKKKAEKLALEKK